MWIDFSKHCMCGECHMWEINAPQTLKTERKGRRTENVWVLNQQLYLWSTLPSSVFFIQNWKKRHLNEYELLHIECIHQTQHNSWLCLRIPASYFPNFTLILFLWQDNWRAFETFCFNLSSLLERSLLAKAIYAESFTKGLKHDLKTDL